MITVGPPYNGHFWTSQFLMQFYCYVEIVLQLSEVKLYWHSYVGTTELVLYRKVKCMVRLKCTELCIMNMNCTKLTGVSSTVASLHCNIKFLYINIIIVTVQNDEEKEKDVYVEQWA